MAKLGTSVVVPKDLIQKAHALVKADIFSSVDQVIETAVTEYLRKNWDPNFALSPRRVNN